MVKEKFSENVHLKDYCTYQIGGPASYFFEPERVTDIRKALAWAASEKVPVYVLGKGSNVLVSDSGFDGLVIYTANTLNKVEFTDNSVKAEAGAELCGLIQACCQKGLAGLENLFDIPGTLGGAVFSNIGINNI